MTEKYEEIEQTCENCKHRNGVNGFDEEPCCYCDEHYNKFELSDGLCVTCKSSEVDYDKWPCDKCFETEDMGMWENNE